MSRIEAAAAMLEAVRRGAPRLAGLGAATPRNEAEAWAVQQAVLRRMGGQRGGKIGGWKCAAPPGKEPSGGMLDASRVVPGPRPWQVPAGEQIGIETEIAFRLGRDLPGRATAYSQEEVLDAVSECMPVIELVSSRYQDMRAVTPLEALADGIAHAGLVYGRPVADWRSRDLNALTVRQSAGGQVQVEKVGGNPSGHAFVALVWLANYLPSVGLCLRAGEIVTTGSCTGLIFVPPGQRIIGGFQGFGEVAVDLV